MPHPRQPVPIRGGAIRDVFDDPVQVDSWNLIGMALFLLLATINRDLPDTPMKPPPHQPFAINRCHALLLLTVFGSLAFMLAMQPIAQDQAYHDFADRGQFLGIPNFFAVISNIPFLLVGIAGLRYCRSSLVAVRGVLSKRPKKGRRCLNMYGIKRAGRGSAKNARSASEPWLLVSSLGLRHLSADAIVRLYSQRMRIEQSFRDTKNLRVGLGLEVARSRSKQRLEMLLLISHLASFAPRLIGECAKQQQLELQFISTRRTGRREISTLTLGRRILDTAPHYLRQLLPWKVIPPLAKQAAYACAGAG